MNQWPSNQTAIGKILLHLSGVFLLMTPAFYNGFPLVYSDTGTYILSGMDWMVPRDRPVFYGIFIRFTSLGASLWGVIFWQAVVVYYVLYRLVTAFSEKFGAGYGWSIVFVLVASTGLGWYTSQLMPDIFAATTIMAVPLLIFVRNTKNQRLHGILLSVIFLIGLLVHFSHILIAFLTLMLFLLFSKKLGLKSRKRIGFLMLSVVFSVTLSGFLNWGINGTFSMGRGGHVYLMGKMYDSGVLESFLENECADGQYALCAYKDSFPESSRGLLWFDNSPLYELGGWQESRGPFYEVLVDIAKHPKYLFMFGYNSAYSSATQLFQNDVGSGLVTTWYANPDSPPAEVVHDFFPQEYKTYQQSRQNENLWGQRLDFSGWNVRVNWMLILSAAFLIFTLIRKSFRSRISPEQRAIVGALVMGVIVNAIVTASLANVYDRLQARVSWLIVLAALLVLVAHFREFHEWRSRLGQSNDGAT